MSWLKLNDSFNLLKDQISNVVQDVLLESNDEGDTGGKTALSQSEIDDLINANQSKDTEIAALRQQILELQKQKPIESSSSNKSPNEQNASLDGSWVWEEEAQSSTQSSKNDPEIISKPSSRGDMTAVPLDNEGAGPDIIRTMQDRLDTNEQKLKKALIESAILNEKMKQLQAENKELNNNMDELDRQHNAAVDNLLELKTNLQKKCEVLEKKLKEKSDQSMISTDIEASKKLDEAMKSIEALSQKCKELENANTVQREEINKKISEEKVNYESKMNSISVQKTQIERDFIALQEDNLQLQRDYHELKQTIESIGKNNDDFMMQIKNLEIEKRKVEQDFIALQEDDLNLQRDYNEYKKSMDSNANEMANLLQRLQNVETEKRKIEQDFIALQEDDLNLQREFNEFKNSISSSNNDNEKLIERLQNIEIEKRKIEQDYIALQEDDLNLQREFHEYKLSIEAISVENENLIKRIEEMESEKLKSAEHFHPQNMEILSQELNELKTQNENLNEKCIEMDRQLTNERKIIEDLKKEQDKHQMIIDKLKTEKSKCEHDYKSLQEENLNLKRKFTGLEEDLAIIDSEKRQLVSSLEKLKSVNASLQSKRMKIENMPSETESQRVQGVEWFGELDVIHETDTSTDDKVIKLIDQIVNCLEKYDIYKGVTRDVNTFLSVFKNVIESAENERMAKQQKYTNLLGAVDKLSNDQMQNSNERLREYVLACMDKISEFMVAKDNLRKQMDESQKLAPISENFEDSYLMLEEQFNESQLSSDNLKDGNEKLRNIYEEWKEQMKKLGAELDDCRDIMIAMKSRNVELEEHINILENEKSNLIFELDEMKSDLTSRNENELSASDEIVELKEDNDRLSAENSELQDRLAKLKNNDLEKIVTEQKIELQEVLKLVGSKESIIEDLNQELNMIKTRKLSDAEPDKLKLEDLQSTVSDLKFSLTEMNNRVQNYQEEIDELRTALKDEQQQNMNNLERIRLSNETIQELQSKLLDTSTNDHLVDEVTNIKQLLEVAQKEKAELVTLITAKHQENVKYHEEIQRIGSLLAMEMEKSKNFICPKCNVLQQEVDKLKYVVQQMNEQTNVFQQREESLSQSLIAEQTKLKKAQQEILDLADQKGVLSKDLDRLRAHLIGIEDAHTLETLELQKSIDEKAQTIMILQEDLQRTSTNHVSANIRANQHTETLQAQNSLLTQRYDEIVAKLSAAEDREAQHQTALFNLQLALEQFQNSKERDVEEATKKLRRDMDVQLTTIDSLKEQINQLKNQLTEATTGLLAASRLSDQLEISKSTIGGLQDDLKNWERKCTELETKVNETKNNQADKVEKGLVKNLVIGYVIATNPTDKSQILKLLSAVLDFNQSETEKAGLNKSQGGWLNNILSSTGNSKSDNREGLAQAFVKFLEKESQPRTDSEHLPNLLGLIHPTPDSTINAGNELNTTHSTNTAGNIIQSQQQSSHRAVHPIVVNESILENFAPARNSSSILKDVLKDS